MKDTTLSYYNYILKKYNISRADFDYSLDYYSQNSEEYLKMYDDVILLIKSKIPELINKNSIFRIFDLVYKNAEILNDLEKYYTPSGKELWRTKNKYEYPKDSTLKVEVSENFWYPCLFVFRADILVYPDKNSSSLKMRIVVDYKDSTKSVVEKKAFENNEKWKRYQLLFWTDSTKKPVHFTASLLDIKDKNKLPHLKIEKISLRQYAPDKDTSKLPPMNIPDNKKKLSNKKKEKIKKVK